MGFEFRDGSECQGVRAAASLNARLHEAAFRAHVPLKAIFELTKRCNLDCLHCYIAGDRSELPTTRWLALVDELAASGCMTIDLSGGELTLRDDWLTIARRVREKRITLTVLTNGTLLTDSQVDELAGLKPAVVAISLYGATPAVHDQITGVMGSFENSVRALRTLRRAGIRCRVSSVLMNENFSEFPGIISLASDLGCSFVFDPTVAPRQDGRLDVLSHRVSVSRLKEFYSHVLLEGRTREYMNENFSEFPGIISLASDLGCSFVFDPTVAPLQDGRLDVLSHRVSVSRLKEFYSHVLLEGRTREYEVARQDLVPRSAKGPCGAGFTLAYVQANGLVNPCVGLEPAFGSVAEETFPDVWRSPTAARFRESAIRVTGKCAACEVAGACTTRCPRLAQAEDGDMTGPSSRACEVTRMVLEWRQELDTYSASGMRSRDGVAGAAHGALRSALNRG